MNSKLTKTNFLEEVFDKYHVELFNFVLCKVGYKVFIAEDITQELFLKLWKKRAHYNPDKASIRTWIYIIARNHIIDHYRTQKNTVPLKAEERIRSNEILEIDVEKKQMIKVAQNVMCQLNDSERELIQLRYIQGLSIKEVSKIINKKRSATKVAIHRAIKKLRKILLDE